MVKLNGKNWKKIKKIKISPDIKEESLNEKGVEKKSETLEEEINNLKFLEFLTPSIEPSENFQNRKSRNIKTLEQNPEVFSFSTKEKSKEEKKAGNYFLQKESKDYEPFSSREEKKQGELIKLFQPTRVDFREVGRDTKMQPRNFFSPNENFIRASSPRKREEERKYNVERVDFTEIGREKRYKLMK
jgi:hypothetical protein